MIIGVNGRFLTKPYTGIGQYTRYLFGELARQNPDDRLLMIVPEKVENDFPSNVEVVVVRERILGTAGMKKTHWEQVKVPRCMRRYKVDVAHFPYPCNPWKGFDRPVVVTVHDTIPWTLPEYRRTFLTRLYQDRARGAVKKADRIVTVSRTSRDAIVKACGVKESHIAVIHNAPAPHFSRKFTPDERRDILQRYNIDSKRPYFLYVGGYDARKNVPSAVDVFLQKIACRFEVDFVLVGKKSLNDRLYSSFDDTQRQHQKEHNAAPTGKGRLVFTGFVKESDLPALYQSALAFVNLSTMEGFNLPLVEAALSGTPMIVSNIPVHHEVIGEYALFSEPGDPKGLAALMTRLITDEPFYARQKEKMEQYECPYSLEKSAQKLMDLYRSLH